MKAGSSTNLEIVVLAAGKGTRMFSDTPKVLHQLAGEPLLSHVLRTAKTLRPNGIHIVCGHGADQVMSFFRGENVSWVLQEEQLGTGHAVKLAIEKIPDKATVLVLYGDIPLVDPVELESLLQGCRPGSPSLLTVVLDDPRGYGRIIRNDDDEVVAIVEEREATSDQREGREINTGIMSANRADLARWLGQIDNRNTKEEYYLTDIIHVAVDEGGHIADRKAADAFRVAGVNNKIELANVEKYKRRQRAREFLEQGVTIIDPDRFDARGDVRFGTDCVIDVNVVLEGPLEIGNNVRIGPNSVLRRSRVGDNVSINEQCVVDDARIDDGAIVGPFSRIRPGSRIGKNVHIGNFVEIKNSNLDAGAKVNHLSYVGDTSVGRNVNVGAGVITCNYDGANKHPTKIEDDAFIGSSSQLVAPVSIGKGSTVGAGSTISEDVPPGHLAVSRAPQKNIKGWRRPKKK